MHAGVDLLFRTGEDGQWKTLNESIVQFVFEKLTPQERMWVGRGLDNSSLLLVDPAAILYKYM